jgi:hypothetical protein
MKGKKSQENRKAGHRGRWPKHLQHINLNAAGINVGVRSHFVVAPEGRDTVSVRESGIFTEDLERLADWLTQCGVTTMAMESTGVYWIPVYELVEARGFEVLWVDARPTRVPQNEMLPANACFSCAGRITLSMISTKSFPPRDSHSLRLNGWKGR